MTSVKILQYIGDCLCDVCLELAKHRRIMLVVSSVENLQSILVDWLVWWCLCDFYKDLAIHRQLSLWLLLKSCNTSAIVFVGLLRTCKTSANYIGCEFCWELAKHSRWLTSVGCLCDFYKDLAIHRWLPLWLLLRSCNTSVIVFVTSA